MRYALLSYLCIVTMIAYVQRSAFNGATKSIESDLAISSSDMSTVMGVWYLAYALFQLPSGWVADRLGSKHALVLFAITWSVFTGLSGLATGLPGILFLWGLMAAAQAGIFPCCTKAIGATYPQSKQAFASGMLMAFMSLGGALAPAITSQLQDTTFNLTWREIFAIYTLPGILWAIAFTIFIPRPETLRSSASPPSIAEKTPNPEHRQENANQFRTSSPWLKLITDPQMLLLSIQQFFRAGPMVIFYTWFARVLSETGDLSQSTAGWLASLPPLLGVLGGVLGGIVSDALLRRTGNARLARQGLTFALLAVGTSVSLAAYFTESRAAVILMSIAAFCGMAAGVSGYSIAMSYGGKRVALVFATMNMSGNLGASFFPKAAGWLVAETGNWNNVLLLFSGMFATGAVCWIILNPKGTLFAEGEERK